MKRPPADEEAPIAPEDVYQETKWKGEVAIREVAARGLDVAILRPTGIYGPGDPARFLLIFRMVKRGRFFVVGDGEACHHPVYVENLVDGFELAAEKPQAKGETFLIADDRYITWNELIPLVAKTMGTTVRIHYLPVGPVSAYTPHFTRRW
ncbi:MAG: NAD-dependent epimerase/dehydratase family protein [Candidatus Binatia bacterium]